MAYPVTPKTWVAGDVLTAAQLNAELRNALLGAFPLGPPDAAWTGFTPTLAQAGAVTKTVTYAKYTRVGRLIVAEVILTVTGTGTAAQPVAINVPVAAAATPGASSACVGSGYLLDTSAGTRYGGIAALSTANDVQLFPTSVNSGVLGNAAFTAALAAGDIVAYSITYEAAT